MLTAADVTRNLLDMIGGNPDESPVRDARRAILDAYTEIADDVRGWNYLKNTKGRLQLVAAYATGTVVYDHTGGSSERLLTLTGGTYPTWVARGDVVRIGEVAYEVETRVDGTRLTLTSALNPGADVASTSYTLYRDTYLLPADFRTGHTPIFESGLTGLRYVEAHRWHYGQRAWTGIGEPTLYTVVGSDILIGRMVVKLSPAPDQTETADYTYHRRPRTLAVFDHAEGSATVTSAAASLTGSATNWTQTMVGSVLRLSSKANSMPTDLIGINPAAHEARISAVASATALTIDAVVSQTFTSAKYQISDPIDLEGMLLVAFQRMAERNFAIFRRHEDKSTAISAAEMALKKAREADSRSKALESAAGLMGAYSSTFRYGSDPVS